MNQVGCRSRACLIVLICFCAATWGQQAPQETPNPVLAERPPAKTAPQQRVIAGEGNMQLDVMVADAAGKPVQDLQPWDFSILDSGKPRKILTFHAFNDETVKPDPPVEVILLIDMVNLPFQQVAFVRDQLDAFLRERGGQLKQPTTLIVLTSAGIRVQPRPSVDGNALAGVVHELHGNISTINSAMGANGMLERFQRSVHQLANIAENEANRPGRKLLIWVGPGWPMLDRPLEGDPARNQRSSFASIVELSNRLREARIVLDSVAPGDSSMGSGRLATLYQAFLKPVLNEKQAATGDLALKVLVTQTGGLILGPDNDLAGQIDRCVADANAFYRLSFDGVKAAHVDEFHDLKVVVNKPGTTVRTNTGYYAEP